MFEWFDKEFKRVIMAIVLFVIFAVIIDMCGCKPIDITDPTPAMNKITMYWNSESFMQDTVELEIPHEGIIHESYFRFQRDNVDSKEPYLIFIGTFRDTVSVSDGELTEITYEKQDVPCATYRIYSEHSVKMHVQVIVYQIGD